MRVSRFTAHTSLTKSLPYFIALAAFGAIVAAWGPVLPQLALQTQTDLGQMGVVFTARALGVFWGSLFSGQIYDRFPRHPVLGGALLVMALTFAAAPLFHSLWLLLFIVFVMGIAAGIVIVGGNTLLMWVHPGNLGPWINGMNFFGALGSFLAPIFITAFLTGQGEIRGAFWILALGIAGAALWALLVPSPAMAGKNEEHHPAAPQPMRWGIVWPFALVFLLYVGIEVSVGGWIYTYTLAMHAGSSTSAGLMTSAFWASIAIGRLLAIPLSSRWRARTILVFDFAGALLSLAGMILFSRSLAALWVSTIGLGLCLASLFPTWLTFAGRRIQITGKVNGIFFASTALGGMTIPWLSGQVFAIGGPRAMIVLLFSILLVASLVFAVMGFRRSPHRAA